MRIIKKIFNNNIVNVADENGEDVILVGAGVGYLTSKGNPVDETRVEREFHLTGQSAKTGTFRILLELPYPIIKTTTRISEYLKQTYDIALTPTVEVGLGDHIAQAVSRVENGTPIYNSMLWETKMTYPAEFRIALEVLEVIHAELGTKLPLDEAGFITLHLVNSGLVGDRSQAMTLGNALHEIVELVEHDLGVSLDESTPTITRFLTHVKFVIQRVTQNQVYNGSYYAFFENLRAEHENVYACAVRIGDYLDEKFNAHITEEEHMYLMLHLCRLEEELSGVAAMPRDE